MFAVPSMMCVQGKISLSEDSIITTDSKNVSLHVYKKQAQSDVVKH